MHISDQALDAVRSQGFVSIEGSCEGLNSPPRQRELYGFPAIGDPYWDEQTLHDVGLRYPGMDMAPYQVRRP